MPSITLAKTALTQNSESDIYLRVGWVLLSPGPPPYCPDQHRGTGRCGETHPATLLLVAAVPAVGGWSRSTARYTHTLCTATHANIQHTKTHTHTRGTHTHTYSCTTHSCTYTHIPPHTLHTHTHHTLYCFEITLPMLQNFQCFTLQYTYFSSPNSPPTCTH